MASDDKGDWTWTFAPRAAKQFETLEHHVQDRIVSKLDEIVDDLPEFRAPSLSTGYFSRLLEVVQAVESRSMGTANVLCHLTDRR